MNISLIHDCRINDDKSGIISHVDDIVPIADVEELAFVLTKHHITPATFKDKKRCKLNFDQIQFIHLDFDNGTTPESIANKLIDYQFVMAGSKNHLKDKGDGNGIIPRFHVFIPIDKPIFSPEEYASGWLDFVRIYGVDSGDIIGKDACRYYFRHSCIIQTKSKGALANSDWLKTSFRRQQYAKQRLAEMPKKKKFSEPIDAFKRTKYFQMLKDDLSAGDGRYYKRLQIVGGMSACGMTAHEATSLFEEFGAFGGDFSEETITKLIR
jgi:hypothetical protein